MVPRRNRVEHNGQAAMPCSHSGLGLTISGTRIIRVVVGTREFQFDFLSEYGGLIDKQPDRFSDTLLDAYFALVQKVVSTIPPSFLYISRN